MISFAILPAESLSENLKILSLNFSNIYLSLITFIIILKSFSFCSSSLIKMQAFSFSRLNAFFTWWSSAACGYGTRIAGIPRYASSIILLIPALQITMSAAEYAICILSMNSNTLTLSDNSFVRFFMLSKSLFPVCQIILIFSLYNFLIIFFIA